MRASAMLAALALLSVPAAAAQDATASKDPRNHSWVEEGVLAIGGGGLSDADVEWLAANGFGAIADFREEHEDPRALIESKGMAFLDMPIDSASHINATQLAAFVAWASAQEAAGRVMYIHCTNGWHRAAAFAVAWDIAKTGTSFDEAARMAMERRPGTVMRATSGVLDYAAELSGGPQLAVALVSPVTRPEPGASMSVSVDAYAAGVPAAGARVNIWSEESKLRIEGVTDASGRFTFSYTAPASAFMDHLYARASLEGYADGADNVEFLFGEPAKSRGAIEVSAERTSEGLSVRVTDDGRSLPVRVIASAPGWTAFESSDRGEVLFRDAPASAIEVRAVSWGSDGGVANVGASSAPTPPPASLLPSPSRQELAAERATAVPHGAPPLTSLDATHPSFAHEASGRELALRYAAAGVVGATLLVLYLVLARSRSGVGSR